jgi:hypothetical protein
MLIVLDRNYMLLYCRSARGVIVFKGTWLGYGLGPLTKMILLRLNISGLS